MSTSNNALPFKEPRFRLDDAKAVVTIIIVITITISTAIPLLIILFSSGSIFLFGVLLRR